MHLPYLVCPQLCSSHVCMAISQLLPKGADLSGPGSVLAVLATPEVLEAAAVLAFIGGMVLWALNFIKVTFGAVVGNISGENEE